MIHYVHDYNRIQMICFNLFQHISIMLSFTYSRPFQALLGPAGKHLALQALEEIRGGILSGRRVELPSAQRQAVFVAADLVQA